MPGTGPGLLCGIGLAVEVGFGIESGEKVGIAVFVGSVFGTAAEIPSSAGAFVYLVERNLAPTASGIEIEPLQLGGAAVELVPGTGGSQRPVALARYSWNEIERALGAYIRKARRSGLCRYQWHISWEEVDSGLGIGWDYGFGYGCFGFDDVNANDPKIAKGEYWFFDQIPDSQH
jgi:hypothetical protein